MITSIIDSFYQKRILLFGMFLIFMGFYFFAPTLFTLNSSLIERKGTVEHVETLYSEVKGHRGGRSTKSELKLTLNEDYSTYFIMKNIGKSTRNIQFEKIVKALKRDSPIQLLVKEKQPNDRLPQVFEIRQNNKILYSISDAKSKDSYGFWLLIILGLIGIGIYLLKTYTDIIPQKFKLL